MCNPLNHFHYTNNALSDAARLMERSQDDANVIHAAGDLQISRKLSDVAALITFLAMGALAILAGILGTSTLALFMVTPVGLSVGLAVAILAITLATLAAYKEHKFRQAVNASIPLNEQQPAEEAADESSDNYLPPDYLPPVSDQFQETSDTSKKDEN